MSGRKDWYWALPRDREGRPIGTIRVNQCLAENPFDFGITRVAMALPRACDDGPAWQAYELRGDPKTYVRHHARGEPRIRPSNGCGWKLDPGGCFSIELPT